jgi:polyhydroxyalkanoate synthase
VSKLDELGKVAEHGANGSSETGVQGEPFFGFRKEDLAATGGALAKEAAAHPTLLLERQAALVRDLIEVLAGQSDIRPSPKDRRFADVTWSQNPFYRVYLGGYLAWCKALDEYIGATTFDERTKARARFIAELLTSASAPSNTLVNPAVLKRVLDTGGGSILHGLRNMLSDLFKNGGLPSQVDQSAFEVGRNLATTEGSVVFRNDVLELIQYKPRTAQVYRIPLLFIPPQVNKYYVFDLSPADSVFDFLLEGGLQVFVISWRNPTARQRDWGMDTYVSAILEAIDAVREICGVEKVSAGAACVGALTLTALQGYYAAGGGESPLNCATHLVSVLDVGTDSMLGMFLTKDVVKAAKAASGVRGVIDGSDMGRFFAWLRPDDLIWSYWVNDYLLGKNPPAFDILYWNADTTRLSAKFHAEILDIYGESRLLDPGKVVVLGRPVDIRQVALDAYFVAGITDHIAHWKHVFRTMRQFSGDRTFVLSAAGHVQSIVNPPAAAAKRQYLLNPSDVADPDEWLAGAQTEKGSWWGHWRSWLERRSGERIAAPAQLGSAQHPALVKAPGTYVLRAKGPKDG